MGFAKLSSELSMKSSVQLDNIFILEYMPFAPESYTKVYLYGKMLAEGNGEDDNSAERISKLLGITEDEVMSAFKYWEERGLIRITAVPPYEVEYIPVRYVRPSQKKFSKSKYAHFNEILSKMFPNRDFLPSEYNEYYTAIEDYHIDPDAMLAIIAYCANLKGKSIGWRYIVTVAKNMSSDGCHTTDEVEARINTLSILSEDITRMFKALKIKRAQDYEDVRLYKKWTEEMGFKPNTIVKVANGVYGEMKGLDTVLTRYFADGLIELDQIEAYKKNRDNLLTLTKELLIKLDVRYNHLDYYAETYVKEWLKMGFEAESLLLIADYCFRHEKKSCDRMKAVLEDCVSEGTISLDVVKSKFSSESKFDTEIKKYFSIAGMSSDVTSRDRDSYNIWVNFWHISPVMIELAAKMSVGEANPRVKMHALIKEWHEKGIDTPSKVSSLNATTIEKDYNFDKLNEKIKNIKFEDL